MTMADQDKKPAGAENKKKIYGRYAKGMAAGRTTYKSKVAGLEDDTFDVGATSDPAKFSKLLKNIENTSRRLTKVQTTWSRHYRI